MKKLFSILMGVAITTAAMSQTTPSREHIDKKKDEKKLENAIVEKKEDRHQVGNDLKHLKVKKAIKHRKAVRADRKKINRRASELKRNHGVKHPVQHAQKKVDETKDAKKDKY